MGTLADRPIFGRRGPSAERRSGRESLPGVERESTARAAGMRAPDQEIARSPYETTDAVLVAVTIGEFSP